MLLPGDSVALDFRLCDKLDKRRTARDARSERVPAVPPDTLPLDLVRDDRLVENHMFPRDVVVLRFNEGATQAQKQAAVDLVHGRVVGGVHQLLPDSVHYFDLYIVRIPNDGTDGPVIRAVSALNALPQCTASVYLYFGKVVREAQQKLPGRRSDTAPAALQRTPKRQ